MNQIYRKSFVFLVILLILLSNISFVNAEEKQKDNPELSGLFGVCNIRSSDSDCGFLQIQNCKDINKKGTAHAESFGCTSKTQTDSCADSDTVKEYYVDCSKSCDDVKSDNIDCPSGYVCSDGKCFVSCTTHNSEKCYDNDVYWYDSCGNKEDKKEDCVNGCLNNKCNSAPECSLTKAYWSKESAKENDEVKLIVEGSNCDGKTVEFRIFEYDPWSRDGSFPSLLQGVGDDEPVEKNPTSVSFSGNNADGKWTAEWQDDGLLNDPEYYFLARADGKIIDSSTPDLSVEESNCTVTNTQYEKKCDGNSVYYYDNCGGKQGLAEDCSVDKCKDSSTLRERGQCVDSSTDAYCSYSEKGCGSSSWGCNGDKEEYTEIKCDYLPYASCWNNKKESNSCANGCNSTTGRCNSAPDQICGNNKKEGSEECDGSDLDGKGCGFFGYNSGTLRCSSCEFDKSDCKNIEEPEPEVTCLDDGYSKYYCVENKIYGTYVDWKKEDNTCIAYSSEKEIQDCGNSYCVAGSCRNDIIEKISVEDADSSIRVYKQPGDYISLIINSKYDKDINFNPGSFSVSSGYSNGKLSLKKGENVVNVYIPTDTRKGDYSFNIDGKNYRFEVINNPALLIVTDRNALFERYNYDTKVYDILAQAHKKADKERGIVYYIDQEGLSGRPFGSFSNYDEEFTDPKITDNSYSLEISRFIKRKCGDTCNDVIILGDDFVVPHYRRRVSELISNWLFFIEKNVKSIYTDTVYIKKANIEFNDFFEMFKQEGKYEGKNVNIILPMNVNSNTRTSIDNLKQSFRDAGYNPDFDEIDSRNVYCYDERFFTDNKDKTLIIIGNEQNNQAFNCFPYVAGDLNRDSVHLQPNVWDPKESALIINTDDNEIINAFAQLIREKNVVKLSGESAYFFRNSVTYVGYGSLAIGVGLLVAGSGGVATPFVLATIAGVVETSADAGDALNTCVINYDGVGWCAGTVGLAIVPFVPSTPVKQALKKFGEFDFVKEFGEDGAKFINGKLDDLFKHLDPNTAKKVINSPADLKFIADGQDILLRKTGQDLKKLLGDMPFDDAGKNLYLRNLGNIASKYGDDVVDDVVALRKINGVDRLADNIARQGGGHIFHAKTANILKNNGFDIESLETPLKKSADGFSDILMKNGDIWEVKSGWAKPNPTDWISEKQRWSNQIDKYVKESGSANKITYVFDSTEFSDDVLNFLKNKGVNIKAIMNGGVINIG